MFIFLSVLTWGYNMEQTLPTVLDEQNLPDWLAQKGWLMDTKGVTVTLLTGGVSNQAFWVQSPQGPCVIKQARPKLAVQMEWLADVRRIIREAQAMDWLYQRIGPPRIPRMLHLDEDAKVLMMEAIQPPAENYKTVLLRGQVDLKLAATFGALLARMHNLTTDAATRERFADASFFDQLRLSPYYDTVAQRHPDLAPRIADLRAECLEQGYCLVHGDYSPKNALVRNNDLVLLDYEVAHWGNPSFDLGFVLTHYLCKALHFAGGKDSKDPAQSSGEPQVDPETARRFIQAAKSFWNAYLADIQLPRASHQRAGYHLATIMLARMDGKSPLEYFTNEHKREIVRKLTRQILLSEEDTGKDTVEGTAEGTAEGTRQDAAQSDNRRIEGVFLAVEAAVTQLNA